MKNLLIITQKVDENDQLLGFFINWIACFARKFDKVTVLCLEKGKFNLPPNVKVLSLGKDYGAGKLKQLSNFYFLIFNLHKDYDAVFVHMNPIWAVAGGLFWRLTSKKIFLWYTSGGVTAKLKLAEKFADIIFTASKESFRLSSKKVIVTGHGIDTDLFKPDPNAKTNDGILKILSVGRISPVKNYRTLIEAVQILANQKINFFVTIIGEPALKQDRQYEEGIKKKIKDLGLEKKFEFKGKIGHGYLTSYYQASNLFVHLSKTGSLDKSLLEAMACGITVLSCNESSGAFLPKEYTFNEANSEELAERIKFAVLYPKNLRDYVVRHHNLSDLIAMLASRMS